MINHHTIVGVVVVSVPTIGCIQGSKAASRDDTHVVTLNINAFGHNSGQQWFKESYIAKLNEIK